MDYSILTDEELVRHCISTGELTPLEVELMLRLERHLDLEEDSDGYDA